MNSTRDVDRQGEWDRLSPLDVVRGETWRSGLFLTFALSLGFFEGVVWPHLRKGGIRQADIVADLTGVRDALGESGARDVGRSYTVHPCWVFEGVFHPKLTALEGDALHLLVGSGNLTFGGWGGNGEVVEHLVPSAHPAAFVDAAAFLEDLATSPRLKMADEDVISRWVETFERAGQGAREGTVRLLHNVQRPIADQLAEQADQLGGAERALVVSPYFGGPDAVSVLAKRLSLDEVEVHVPSALPFRGELYPFHRSKLATPVRVDLLSGDDDDLDRPLHAKVIEIVCRQGRLLLSGSVNASTPALATPRNIELGVLRIDGATTSPLRRRPAPAPDPASLAAETESQRGQQALVFARAEGDTVSGIVLGPAVEGVWTLFLIWAGARRDCGPAEVGPDGAFTVRGVDLSSVTYGAGRATLLMKRAERTAEGFLALKDNLELGRAMGAAAGAMMRTATGSGDDEDLAAVLEWMAMHPDESLQPWRSSEREPSADVVAQWVDPSAARIITDDELADVRRPTLGGGQAAIDRLLARLRLQLQTPPDDTAVSLRGEHEELEDLDEEGGDGASPQGTAADPVLGVFEQIWSVLRERVPLDPPAELMRLAEVGAHVILRRGASLERVESILGDWAGLAITHLDPAVGGAVVQVAKAFTVLAAALDGETGRARRRLIHFAGGAVDPAAFDVDRKEPLVERLIVHAVGADAFATTLQQVRDVRSAFDDLMTIRAAVVHQAVLPRLAVIEAEPEVAQVRKWIERGRPEMVVLLDRPLNHCPKHFRALPSAQVYRLAGRGLATPDCCDRVLVNLRP